jgi:hypothetical protein
MSWIDRHRLAVESRRGDRETREAWRCGVDGDAVLADDDACKLRSVGRQTSRELGAAVGAPDAIALARPHRLDASVDTFALSLDELDRRLHRFEGEAARRPDVAVVVVRVVFAPRSVRVSNTRKPEAT